MESVESQGKAWQGKQEGTPCFLCWPHHIGRFLSSGFSFFSLLCQGNALARAREAQPLRIGGLFSAAFEIDWICAFNGFLGIRFYSA
jgi:hypothetical protein